MASPSKAISKELAIQKIARYCAYQERSHFEVREKLRQLGQWGDTAEEIITQLVVDGYLNEERFAKAFAGGKFRMKKWGRIKIQRALEAKGVSKNCIKSGLREIDEADYKSVLKGILETRLEEARDENPYAVKDKAATYAIRRGFEPELVWEFLRT